MRALGAAAALAALAALLVTGGCGDDEPQRKAAPVPDVVTWNPCDALDLDDMAAWFGSEFVKDAGTPDAPVCTFAPGADGDPVVNANYMLFPDGLDAVFDTMDGLDPDDVRRVTVRGADAATMVVDHDDRQLFVSGFVQNGDLIQTVDVVDPLPYDQGRALRAVRAVLAALSTAAP